MITATHSLVIVKPGEGVVDTAKLVERFRNGELITFDVGSCTLP